MAAAPAAAYNTAMTRVLAAVGALLVVAALVAGCGSSWQAGIARQYGSEWGDSHATIFSSETVQLTSGAKVDVLELRGHFRRLACSPVFRRPGTKYRPCPVAHPDLIQVALYEAEGHPLLSAGNGDTRASLAVISHARAVRPVLKAFPDFSGLIVACTVPAPLVPHPIPGACSTQLRPKRVVFAAAWPLSRPSGTRHVAGWVVRLGPDGRVLGVTLHRHGPSYAWR